MRPVCLKGNGRENEKSLAGSVQETLQSRPMRAGRRKNVPVDLPRGRPCAVNERSCRKRRHIKNAPFPRAVVTRLGTRIARNTLYTLYIGIYTYYIYRRGTRRADDDDDDVRNGRAGAVGWALNTPVSRSADGGRKRERERGTSFGRRRRGGPGRRRNAIFRRRRTNTRPTGRQTQAEKQRARAGRFLSMPPVHRDDQTVVYPRASSQSSQYPRVFVVAGPSGTTGWSPSISPVEEEQ